MTNPVAPTHIDALPPAPQPNDTPAEFDSKAFASLQAQPVMVLQTNALADQTYQNAVAANERAVSAGAAQAASESARDIAVSAKSSAESARDLAQGYKTDANNSAQSAAQSAIDAADASRLTIGMVSTGTPGSPAQATITGSAGAQSLNLTLPKGDAGPAGSGDMNKADNLAGLADVAAARGNLGLGSAATAALKTTTGSSTTDVMTQKATSDALDALLDVPTSTVTSGAYTLQLADRGKCVDVGHNITVPKLATVAFPKGSVINLQNNSGTSRTLTAESGATVYLAGDSSKTGPFTLKGYGWAVLRKIDTASTWVISGAGI